MIDFTNYPERKKKGHARLICTGKDQFILAQKRFNPNDGTEVPPTKYDLTRAQMLETRRFVEDQLRNIQEILVEMDELDPVQEE